jgi:hypothetical protein
MRSSSSKAESFLGFSSLGAFSALVDEAAFFTFASFATAFGSSETFFEALALVTLVAVAFLAFGFSVAVTGALVALAGLLAGVAFLALDDFASEAAAEALASDFLLAVATFSLSFVGLVLFATEAFVAPLLVAPVRFLGDLLSLEGDEVAESSGVAIITDRCRSMGY